MYQINQRLISNNRSYKKLTPIGIALHETDNPGGSDEAHFNYFNTQYRGASAHAFVDWDSITQLIPWDEVSWHAGKTANNKYIGVELCHAKTKEQFQEVWERSTWLFAYLFVNVLKLNTVNEDNLPTHKEISLKWRETNHVDPDGYFLQFGKTVQEFRDTVQCKINDMQKPITQDMEGFDLNKQYKLEPVCKGMLKNTTTLTCCSKPSNSSRTSSVLKKGVNEPVNIYASVKAEEVLWYLVNPNPDLPQWVAAHYIQLI